MLFSKTEYRNSWTAPNNGCALVPVMILLELCVTSDPALVRVGHVGVSNSCNLHAEYIEVYRVILL
jgi:hypothetical protein